MTSTLLCDKMDTESEYQFQCSRAGWAWGENRESGETPERYRHCERGGPGRRRKPAIGSVPRRHCCEPRMRESGYLLRRFVYVRSCKYGIAAAFGAERRLRQFSKTAAAFLILWCCVCGFPLTIFDRLPSREFLRDRGGVDSPLLYYENLPRRSFMAAAAFVVMV